MLTAYRRHLRRCQYRLRTEKKCQCPVWIQGTCHGVWLKKSLGIRNWESAQKYIRDLESGVEVSTESVKTAADKFLADAVAREVGLAQLGKYRLLFAELNGWYGDKFVGDVSVANLRAYRESWTVAATTAAKKLERLRTFFKFCNESGWIAANPAKSIRPPRANPQPTLPFSESDIETILNAIDCYPERPHGRRQQIRAFVLLLRWTGLRIGDVVKLRRSDYSDGKLFLYTQKTGTPVRLLLHADASKILDTLPVNAGGYYFWSGNGLLKSAVADWQRSLAKLFKLAGISGHAHRFRDTFAVWFLSKGLSLENVSILLGHENIRTTQKHYAPWVQSRQQSLEAAVSRAWRLTGD